VRPRLDAYAEPPTRSRGVRTVGSLSTTLLGEASLIVEGGADLQIRLVGWDVYGDCVMVRVPVKVRSPVSLAVVRARQAARAGHVV
jgi:hypothetical protein